MTLTAGKAGGDDDPVGGVCCRPIRCSAVSQGDEAHATILQLNCGVLFRIHTCHTLIDLLVALFEPMSLAHNTTLNTRADAIGRVRFAAVIGIAFDIIIHA